ncbi:hypothetical protein J2TS4_17130 [Paenibacillus sp. J2TS4]|nr:hypothetical protein J2TS4_17130 [Paenibacillus sp. J2TS4]
MRTMDPASLPPHESEVALTGLTPVASDILSVPGVREAKIRMECALEQAIPLGGSDETPACDFLVELCRYGNELGLEWWTSEEIAEWFRTRRQIQVDLLEDGPLTVRIESNEEVRGVTILLPRRPDEQWQCVGCEGREGNIDQSGGLSTRPSNILDNFASII